MKHTTTTFLGAMIVAAVVGCSDPPAEPKTGATDPDVVGTWAVISPKHTEGRLTIHADGTWSLESDGPSFTGTYAFEGNTIVGTSAIFRGPVKGETMVLTWPDDMEMTLARESKTAPGLSEVQQEFPDLGTLSHVMLDTRQPAFVVITGIRKGTPTERMAKFQETAASDDAIELIEWDSFKPDAVARLAARIVHDEFRMKRKLPELLVGVQNRAGTAIALTWNGGIAITSDDREYTKKAHAEYAADPAAYRAKPKSEYELDPVHPDNYLPFLAKRDEPPGRRSDPDKLLKAAAKGDLEEVKRLVAAGMDANHVKIPGITPLGRAVEGNHTAVAKFLIQSGADVNGATASQQRPLLLAAERGFAEVAAVLIKYGADIGAEAGYGELHQGTPLHVAASKGHAAVVELLLKNGADINARQKHGWPSGGAPLHLAAEWDRPAVAALLIRHGADLNLRDRHGATPLFHCAGDPEAAVAKLLIANGAQVNIRDDSGTTPLHRAAAYGNIKMAELLIERGAAVDIQNDFKKTPLQSAEEARHQEFVELLKKHGAKNS